MPAYDKDGEEIENRMTEKAKGSQIKAKAMAEGEMLVYDSRGKEEEKDQFNYVVEEFHRSPKSVYYINYRAVYEDNYPAKFDPELARMLISLYSKKGELVVDPMCGSGVIPLTAAELGRRAFGQDVNPKAIDILRTKFKRSKLPKDSVAWSLGDSRKQIPIARNSAGAIITSPPFGIKAIVGSKKQYSAEKADITNAPDYPTWRGGLKEILYRCYDILKPGRLMMVEIRPRSVDGHDKPMDLWIQDDAIEIGFERWGRIIETVDPWRMYTVVDRENGFVKPYPGHADVLIFKKPKSAAYDKLSH